MVLPALIAALGAEGGAAASIIGGQQAADAQEQATLYNWMLNMYRMRKEDKWRQQQIDYAREKMLLGKPLGRAVRGRFGFQLRIMINGGLRVLELLEKQQNDLFSRPRLGKRDWLRMVWRSL